MTIDLELGTADWHMRSRMTVPSGPTRMRQMLPLVQVLADRVVDAAVKGVEAAGQKISCKAGCGACCRQMVPISEVEARRIGELVDGMPEPRRAAVRARFTEARKRLDEAGLLDPLLRRDAWSEDDTRSLGVRYFAAGIPCPFLENESCSIHSDRPITCREYLVTSPAENCANPTPETIRAVKLPLKVWTALARVGEPKTNGRRPERFPWVPLALAPEWAEANAEEPAARPGPELLRELFDHMTGKERDGEVAR